MHDCDANATCTDTASSFTCACNDGFTGDGKICTDVDECSMNNGGCDLLVTCTNTPGAFMCGECPVGYSGDGVTGCTDIDECAANNGGCDVLTTCTNTPGSRTCGACPNGYTGDGAAGCVDIDECATNNGGCEPLVTCTNTTGSFTCGDCAEGYTGGGAGGCIDIDECMTNNGGCDALTVCTNTPGSFTCGACPAGYTGNGAVGCALAPCVYQYSEEHGDIFIDWSASEGLTLHVRSELEPGMGELLYPPEQVCVVVPASSQVARPAATEWAPLGVEAGETVWFLSQTALAGQPWFGIAPENIPNGTFHDNLVTLHIDAIQQPAGAQLSSWTSSVGVPTFIYSTSTGLLASQRISGSHAHMNWGFTQLGEYRVSFKATGLLSGTQAPVESPVAVYRFRVE